MVRPAEEANESERGRSVSPSIDDEGRCEGRWTISLEESVLTAISGERDEVGEVGLWLRSVGPDQEEDAPADEADEDRSLLEKSGT
jgi:hypothetical protein